MSAEQNQQEEQQTKPRIKSHWEKVRDIIEDPTSTARDLREILGSNSINNQFPERFPFHTKPIKSNYNTHIYIQGPTILQLIIMNERADLLQKMFDSRRGPNPLQRSRDGNYNAVHVACMTKDTACLEILLKCESVQKHINDEEMHIKIDDIIKPTNPTPGTGTNPLHLAVSYDFPKTVVLLTQKYFPKPVYGHDDSKPDNPDGQYPLDHASTISSHIEIIASGVCSDDSDVEDDDIEFDEGQENQGLNPGLDIDSLNILSSSALFDAVMGSKARLTFLLLALGADINQTKVGNEDDTNCVIPEGWSMYDLINNRDQKNIWQEDDKRRIKHIKKIYEYFTTHLLKGAQITNNMLLKLVDGNDYCNRFEEEARKKLVPYFVEQHLQQSNDDQNPDDRFTDLQNKIRVLQNKIEELQRNPPKDNNHTPNVLPTKKCRICGKNASIKCQHCQNDFCAKCINKQDHQDQFLLMH